MRRSNSPHGAGVLPTASDHSSIDGDSRSPDHVPSRAHDNARALGAAASVANDYDLSIATTAASSSPAFVQSTPTVRRYIALVTAFTDAFGKVTRVSAGAAPPFT